MEYINLVPKSYVTKTTTRVINSGYLYDTAGSIENIYDGNVDTYYQETIRHGGDGYAEGSLTFDAVWTKPKKIYRVYVYSTQGTYGGNYKESYMVFTIYLRISGNWISIDEWAKNEPGFGSNYWGWRTYERNLTTGWDNVTGIRHRQYGYSYSYEGDRQQFVKFRFHEVQCYREKWAEIFRIAKGGSVVRLGRSEVLAGNKLRTCKGTSIYAVPLVDTDDPEASAVRIYDGSAVKSIVLAD